MAFTANLKGKLHSMVNNHSAGLANFIISINNSFINLVNLKKAAVSPQRLEA